MSTPTATPFGHPVYIMPKPAGPMCNLRCKYCYYLEKEALYPERNDLLMSDELLEKFIREYIGMQTIPEVLFTWHGGETLLRPLSFYKKALKLQKKYAHGRRITNVLQTNGVLLTDEWCRFFRDNNFLVGISIDGPERFHDRYRVSRGGAPTFSRVMRGINLLKQHGVEYNAMAVVNDLNGDHPLEFYGFFKEIECHYIQFTPIVERFLDAPGQNGPELASRSTTPGRARLADFSVRPDQWGHFLITLFDEWVRRDVGVYYVQLFDSTLASWMGMQPGLCTMAKTCGHAGAMEHNGDLFSCDHFVFPEYKLGNIHTQTLTSMMYSERQLQFGRDKYDRLTPQCKECPYLFACYGECPKNRFVSDCYGTPGHNYLCEGYYMFFEHIAPYMDYMKEALLHEAPPAGIMKILQTDPLYFEKRRNL